MNEASRIRHVIALGAAVGRAHEASYGHLSICPHKRILNGGEGEVSAVIDPRQTAILIRSQVDESFQDKTKKTLQWESTTSGIRLVLQGRNGPKEYSYKRLDKVLVLQDPCRYPLDKGSLVQVCNEVWSSATEVLRFDHPAGAWARVFYSTQEGEKYSTRPAEQVRIVENAADRPRAAKILGYWRDLVAHLPDLNDGGHPLKRAYESMSLVNSESVLARYLSGDPIEEEADQRLPIFPFSSNLSQHEALVQSLRYPVSVIDGPPGTGKTQTILNLLATLSTTPGVRVGVVSANNAAVDNVREKLEKLDFGFIVAGLGRREKKEAFFAGQNERNAAVERILKADESSEDEAETPSLEEQLRHLGEQILQLQQDERALAQLRQELEGHKLEFRHFSRYLEGHEVADLDGVPLLRRDPDRILDFLAETQLAEENPAWPLRWVRRLRWLMKYGRLKGADPNDGAVVLELQRAYYESRITELTREITRLEEKLAQADLLGLTSRQHELSLKYFRVGLRRRYGSCTRKKYDLKTYKDRFDEFSVDYPIILSTCHSLRGSIGEHRLLDYLIIDEASQVDLLAAGLALASAKRVVVVGDLQQLPHIPSDTAAESAGTAPLPAYDYVRNNLLSSLQELYGEKLPRTMLREHYRCDPAIIGFCNEKFYGRQLIPFRDSSSGSRPLVLHTTVEGNHMRSHREGGRSNQREIDVIEQEVIPEHCADIPREEIGVTSPYRRQVTKIGGLLVADLKSIEADTVHGFQGREKRAVIMSTVLDETREGHKGTSFVDKPNLINVAVSRAKDRFVLVTNYDMMPKTRNLRDLMEYVRYHDPEYIPHRSSLVSVFDLLYQRYSERLTILAGRLWGESKYRSENIIWTLLQDLLSEERFRELEAIPQMIVQNLLPDMDGLTEEEATYVKHRCSLDFVIQRRVTRRPVLAIEVNGFEFHENRADRRAKDKLKESIMRKKGLQLLPLSTTGSGEESRIREALENALEQLG